MCVQTLAGQHFVLKVLRSLMRRVLDDFVRLLVRHRPAFLTDGRMTAIGEITPMNFAIAKGRIEPSTPVAEISAMTWSGPFAPFYGRLLSLRKWTQ